jgi:8-oxo-dGTP pyrophosphatase MutT (NUDIX family)
MTNREEELLARVEGILAETRRDAERVTREDAPREEQRAEAARRGDLGSDWQAVQGRIDAGETSLTAVFGGEDATPAAVRLQRTSRETIEALELPDDVAEELAVLREAMP